MYQGGELHLHCGWKDSISLRSTKFMRKWKPKSKFEGQKNNRGEWLPFENLIHLLGNLSVIDRWQWDEVREHYWHRLHKLNYKRKRRKEKMGL